MKKTLAIALTAVSLLLLTACSSQKESSELLTNPIKESTTTMGTYVQVSVYNPGKRPAAQEALRIAESYSDLISMKAKNSEIKKINDSAGESAVRVTDDVYQLVKLGYQYSAKHEGYDITVGPLSGLWHIGFPDAKKPSQAEIDQAVHLIDYKDIHFNDEQKSIELEKAGMSLDLGSITKGYVAMKMVDYLKSKGVTSGIVDLGSSSIYVIGDSARGAGQPWKIGIKDPNQPNGDQLGVITASNQHINSSGIYERYLLADGKRYSHILDPKTGYPFDNDLASVTLLISGDDPTNGDGLSMMVYAMGTKKGYDYILHHEKVQAIFIDKKNRIFLTPGMKDKFTLSKDSQFKIADISEASD
ncbi:FAD:protein FMN transferase [Lactococcus termiticola]|uniref:FAD:protein FMN transferase n=1 Tax=Lactococcus termiticola TaxID=2169526 RepID=A0A2R5HK90_9LACT|nr:FAD:protein FMN transferase [Lactococcus termiticola]GBG97188.1 thiamine biosynthesis lipoprotein [Lactococcus termiticola]